MTRCPALPSDPLPVPPSPRDARLKPVELRASKSVHAASSHPLPRLPRPPSLRLTMMAVSMDSIGSMKPPAPDAMSAARPRTSRMPEPKPRAAASRNSCHRPRRRPLERLEMRNAPPFQIPCSVGLCPSQRLGSLQGISPTPTRRPTLSVNSFQDWPVPASRLSKASPPSSKA